MKKLKKVISIVLLFMFALSSVGVYAEEVLVEKHSAFGLYASEDEMQKEDEYITRERFASVLSVFYGAERGKEELGGMGLFSDVSADHWAAGAITAVCNDDCMLGFSDGTFRPKDAVTFDQAVRSFVILLGYKEYSQHMGGYLVQATRLGLLTGVTATGTEKLTKAQFSILLRNALKCETLKFHSITNDGYTTYVESGTLLEEMLDIYEITGVVNATETMSIGFNSVLPKNKVKIGDYILDCYQPIDDYIGMLCRAYYRKDDDGMCTLIYIEENEKNDVLKVSAKDIIPDKTTLTSFTYVKSNNKVSTAKISSTASMIFNGRNHTYFELTDLTPASGSVRLIDTDKNGEYDTIIVESFVDYFIDNVTSNNGIIRIVDSLGKQAIEIDINNEENKLNVYKNGEKVEYSEIMAGNVISVAESKGTAGSAKSYKIMISDKVVVDTLKVYNESKGTVSFQDTEVELSAYYNTTKYPIKIGVKTNVHLNAFGEVVALSTDTRGFEYGFMTAVDPGEVFSTNISIRIFTEKSSFEIFKTAKVVDIDGTNIRNKDTLITTLQSSATEYLTKTQNSITPSTGYEQLVRFEKNSKNEITMIDTVCVNVSDIEEETEFDDVTLLNATPTEPIRTFPSARTIEGQYCFVKDAPTFFIPQDVTDTKGYKTTSNFSGVNDTFECKVCLFDMDEMNVFRTAVINKAGSTSVDRKGTNTMILVDEIGQTLNDDYEVVNEISGYKVLNGGKVSVMADDEIFNTVSINPGDIIRYSTGSDGMATVIEKTASLDGTGTTLSETSPYTKFYDDFRITMGRVVKKNDVFVKIHYGGSTPVDNVNILDGVSCVLVYDADAKGVKTRKGTINDIKADEDFGEGNGSMIFTYQYYGLINALVIYE